MNKSIRLTVGAAVTCVVSACTEAPIQAPASASTTSSERMPSPATAAKPARPAPIPTRLLNARADCSFKDETGYKGRLKLHVEAAKVNVFEAVLEPRGGTCTYKLEDFKQTATLPIPVLTGATTNSARCIARIWEQGPRITVAFDHCEKMCTGGVFQKTWPILVDAHDGSCG